MNKKSLNNASRRVNAENMLRRRQLKTIWQERLAASKKKVARHKRNRLRKTENAQIIFRYSPEKYRKLKKQAVQRMLYGLVGMSDVQHNIINNQGLKGNWHLSADIKKHLYNAAMKRQLSRTAVTAGLALGLTLSFNGITFGMPQDGQIVAGDGTITVNGQKMDISQVTDKMIIDWQKFGINPNEMVNFIQPGSNSVALNRVIGADASQIMGHMSANGQVFLVNPNGIIFGAGAQVDVGGLVASTMNITNDNFLKGNYVFEGSSQYGKIENLGTLNANEKGYVALIAPDIVNKGIIRANMGTVLMASGEKVSIDFDGDGMLSYAVEPSTIKTAIENHNLVQADGGTVYMSTGAGNKIAESLLVNDGIIRANGIENRNGKILLVGGNITQSTQGVAEARNGSISLDAKKQLNVAGNIDVSADDKGGSITLLANNIHIAENTVMLADGDNKGGNILVGGDFQGTGILKHANTLTVDQNVNISADAKKYGNGGKVVFWSDDITTFKGNVSARGGKNSGDGGFVEVSGKNTLRYDGFVDTRATNGKTGNLLLDPSDYTIAASGGDITGVQLAANLATSNITILSSQGTYGGTNGDILVNDNVNYDGVNNGNHNLTLSAYRNISFATNKTITFGGSGVLNLRADNIGLGTSAVSDPSTMGTLVFASGSGVVLNNTATANVYYNPSYYGEDATVNTAFDGNITPGSYTAYMLVNDIGNEDGSGTGLQGINNNLFGNYALGRDIDASATINWNVAQDYPYYQPAFARGWNPLGNPQIGAYQGNFDGLGHVIDGLYMNNPVNGSYQNFVGLFGQAGIPGVEAGATISNLGITNCNMASTNLYDYNYLGALVGWGQNVNINSCYVSGSLTMGEAQNTDSSDSLGGLIGYAQSCNIDSSYNMATLTAGQLSSAGGLVGTVNMQFSAGCTISNSYNMGAIFGDEGSNLGGLLGYDSNGASSITSSYNLGSVTGVACSAVPPTWPSQPYTNIGGLVGYNGGYIASSYNLGNVVMTVNSDAGTYANVGGLVGYDSNGSLWMTNSYNAGTVTGTAGNNVGGLVGDADCYYGGTGAASSVIKYSYNTGAVTGGDHAYVGGLVGYTGLGGVNENYVNLSSSYNVGSVTGGNYSYVGGILGKNIAQAASVYSYFTINYDCYNAGRVVGGSNAHVGGVIGWASQNQNLPANIVTSCLWDTTTSGQSGTPWGGGIIDAYGNYGYNTANMKKLSTFSNWSIGNPGNDWQITNTNTYPVLTWDAVLFTGSGASTNVKQYVAGFANASSTNSPINTFTESGGNFSVYIQKGWHSLLTAGSDRALIIGEDNTGTISTLNASFVANTLKTVYNTSLEDLRNFDVTSMQQLYTVTNNNNVNFANNIAFSTGSNAIFFVDGNITTTNAGMLFGGSVIAESATALTAASSGAITFADSYRNIQGTTTVAASGSGGGVTFTGAANTNGEILTIAAGNSNNFTATNASNDFGTVIVNSAGNVALVDSDDLSIGNITATGTVLARTLAGDLTQTGRTVTASTSATAVTLAAAGNYINSSGSTTPIGVGTGGHWLIYSTTPVDDSLNGLNSYSYRQYNVHYGASPTYAGNGLLYSTAPTLSSAITSVVTKVYDGNNTAYLNGATFSTTGLINGDAVTSYPTIGTYDNKNAGTGKTVTANISSSIYDSANKPVYGYQGMTVSSTSGRITAKTLATLSLTVADKIYNGSNSASVNNSASALSLAGVMYGDNVMISPTATFSDKNAAAAKAVNILPGAHLGGSDGGNYVLNATSYNTTATAAITPKSLSVSGSTAVGRNYDGTTNAVITVGTLSGLVGAETVTADAIGTFDSKNAGSRTATAVYTLVNGSGGGLASNYSLSNTTGLAANDYS